MKQTAGYFIVEASAMPEIFRKVAEAKRLLETGEETTVNRAAQAVGISRSAYYKYKDAVRPFNDMLHGRIVTFQTMLKDEPGILSGLPAAAFSISSSERWRAEVSAVMVTTAQPLTGMF